MKNIHNTDTKLRPARPRIIRFTSRVVQPPASGVPAENAISNFTSDETNLELTCWSEPWVNHVDIQAEIHRRVPNAFSDSLDNFCHTKVINIIRRNELKANRGISDNVPDILCGYQHRHIITRYFSIRSFCTEYLRVCLYST